MCPQIAVEYPTRHRKISPFYCISSRDKLYFRKIWESVINWKFRYRKQNEREVIKTTPFGTTPVPYRILCSNSPPILSNLLCVDNLSTLLGIILLIRPVYIQPNLFFIWCTTPSFSEVLNTSHDEHFFSAVL